MLICYFVSEYPAVSHTFIRREIVELERNGDTVFRVSLRSNARKIVDQADLQEQELTKYLFDTGPFQFMRALLTALARRPHRLLKAACSAIRMMRRSSRPMVFHAFYLAEAVVIANWLRERKVAHVHAHFGTNAAEVAMLAHLITGVPYSFTVHGPDEFDRPEYLGLPEKLEHAAFVAVISSFTAAQIRRWIPPRQWQKIKLVRCGLDADFLRQHPVAKLSRDHLVSVGRLSGQKGQLVLLDALQLLARQNVRFTLTIAGDGPLRPELERRIREHGLSDRVRLTGWLTNGEIRDLIMAARALVLPSFAEGLPVVLMEALALGRPVVATYVGGIPELVVDDVNGWLVPAGDADRLAQAIRECLRAPDARIQTMGQLGRARVLEMHDIARECRRLADLFAGQEAAVPSLASSANELKPAAAHLQSSASEVGPRAA